MKRFPASALLTSAVLATVLPACAPEPERAATAPVTGERIVAAEAVIDSLKPVSAVVASRDLGEARARISGTLVQLNVREGDIEAALVGGVNLILAPDVSIGLTHFGGLSPDGRCKAFAASANGFAFAAVRFQTVT